MLPSHLYKLVVKNMWKWCDCREKVLTNHSTHTYKPRVDDNRWLFLNMTTKAPWFSSITKDTPLRTYKTSTLHTCTFRAQCLFHAWVQHAQSQTRLHHWCICKMICNICHMKLWYYACFSSLSNNTVKQHGDGQVSHLGAVGDTHTKRWKLYDWIRCIKFRSFIQTGDWTYTYGN